MQRLSQGLDYVVATAGARGMRVILTLTNYLPAYGGAQQWVHWYGGGTITDFWKRQDIRHAAHLILLTSLKPSTLCWAFLPENVDMGESFRVWSGSCL